MRRREMLALCAGAIAAADVPAAVSSIESIPEPLLLTITTDRTLSVEQVENLQKVMRPIQEQLSARLGYQLPVVLLDSGIRSEAVTDPAFRSSGE